MFALQEGVWHLLQNPYDTAHLTLGMLVHYLGKPEIQIYCRCGRKRKQIAFLIAILIHPQILTFSVFKIANLSPYWCHCSFTYLLWRSICGIGNCSARDVTVSLSTINMILSDKDEILIKKVCIWGGRPTQRRGWQVPEKSWTKHGVNKLFKKLRDAGIVDRLPGSDRPLNARTEENAKVLL